MTKKRSGMKPPLVLAGMMASVGVVTMLVGAGKGSPGGYIDDNYRKVSSGTYSSSEAPMLTAAAIRKRYETWERVYTPSGVYLRYHDAVVGILPAAGGSRITVDKPGRGYDRYHYAVGGVWGGPGGSASSSFRGGGPGGGGK